MFSVGIFTTHLPYIIIITFYAIFLIFGVEKASKGEINSESVLSIEIDSDNFNIESCYDLDFRIEKPTHFAYNFAFENLHFKCKLEHPEYTCSKLHQECFIFPYISRPPPVV